MVCEKMKKRKPIKKKRYRKVLSENEFLNAHINWHKDLKERKTWREAETIISHTYEKAAAESPKWVAKLKKEETELRKKYNINEGRIIMDPNFDKLLESKKRNERADLKKLIIIDYASFPKKHHTSTTTFPGRGADLRNVFTDFVANPAKKRKKKELHVTVVGTGVDPMGSLLRTAQPYEIKDILEKKGIKCSISATEMSDKNVAFLESARKKLGEKGENIKFGKLDIITGTPIKSDAIVMTQLLRYLPDHKIRVAVQHATDALKKGGKLILSEDIEYPKLMMLQSKIKGLKLVYKPGHTKAKYNYWIFEKK